MKEYTLIIDENNYFKDYSELYDYLFELNGVEDVVIVCDELVHITVKYQEKLINDEIIRLEILAFLEISNYPCIQGFDKHSSEKDIVTVKLDYRSCCELCHANIIYTLIDTPGIIKVDSDFYQNYWIKSLDNYSITISYDPKIISKEKWKEIKKEIDVYS